MFGLLKENILNRLEETYLIEGNETNFKVEFNKFMNVVKNDKDLKNLYEMYISYNDVTFDDYDIAKEFVNESIDFLKKVDKKSISKLENLIGDYEFKKLKTESIEFKLDQLVFNENLSVKDKFLYKANLIKQLTQGDKPIGNFTENFNVLTNELNENISKLNEVESEVLNLFVENDLSKIKNYYQNLINETTDLVEDKILVTENIETMKRLVEVKRRLKTLKGEEPTIDQVGIIIELKNSF